MMSVADHSSCRLGTALMSSLVVPLTIELLIAMCRPSIPRTRSRRGSLRSWSMPTVAPVLRSTRRTSLDEPRNNRFWTPPGARKPNPSGSRQKGRRRRGAALDPHDGDRSRWQQPLRGDHTGSEDCDVGVSGKMKPARRDKRRLAWAQLPQLRVDEPSGRLVLVHHGGEPATLGQLDRAAGGHPGERRDRVGRRFPLDGERRNWKRRWEILPLEHIDRPLVCDHDGVGLRHEVAGHGGPDEGGPSEQLAIVEPPDAEAVAAATEQTTATLVDAPLPVVVSIRHGRHRNTATAKPFQRFPAASGFRQLRGLEQRPDLRFEGRLELWHGQRRVRSGWGEPHSGENRLAACWPVPGSRHNTRAKASAPTRAAAAHARCHRFIRATTGTALTMAGVDAASRKMAMTCSLRSAGTDWSRISSPATRLDSCSIWR